MKIAGRLLDGLALCPINYMKKDEIKAKIFLESIGFPVDDIIYEPDGNIPPDFLVKPSLAIEVRRLNKHIQLEFNERPEPLEK